MGFAHARVCWYSDRVLCCFSLPEGLTSSFTEDPEVCEETGCTCRFKHLRKAGPCVASVAETPVLAAAWGLNQMSNAAGSSLESLDSLLIWTFAAWHRIRCYLIFGRPKGLVISRPDLKVMGKLRKFEAFMEFAGSLSALFFFLVLLYPHGSYPIIKPQHYPGIPIVLASFLYSLNWNPFYYIPFRALISIEREMLIIWLATDYRDPSPPSFLILMELPVCSLSLQHIASK